MVLTESSWAGELRSRRALDVATLVFAAGFLAHNGDHLRRGIDTTSGEVVAGGTLLTILSVLVIALVVARQPRAPQVATIVGFAGAVGVAAVHLLPDWGVFSDSFPSGHVDGLTWAAGSFEIAALFALGLAGRYADRKPATRAHASALT